MLDIVYWGEFIRNRLLGKECILAYETAADYLGLSNGGLRESLMIFVTKPLGLPDTKEFLVPSFSHLKTLKRLGITCTTPEQTIINLLEQNENEQVIYEVLANYYFSNEESFNSLVIPDKLKEIFQYYAEFAVHYYDE